MSGKGIIHVDMNGFKRLTKDLEVFARSAMPHAARNALNAVAFEARKEWAELAKARMTLRNTYTVRSITYDKATGTDISTMQSRVGSKADYMEHQEEGDTRRKKGKYGVPIPTASAAGQAMRARPRTRLVQKRSRMSAMDVPNRVGGNRQRKNAVAILLAPKHGGIAFLNLGKRKGLFRIEGRKRGLSIRMLWDLSRPTVKTPRNPMLADTLKAVGPRVPRLLEKALIEQLKKRKVFGY